MADQIILKHINEAVQNIGTITLDQLEIELRINRTLDRATFEKLEKAVANGKWETEESTETVDKVVGDVRITDGTRAIRKKRVSMTDAGMYRVVTSHEQPVAIPPAVKGHSIQRTKHRREWSFWGWKLSLTRVNPETAAAGYECELELIAADLVRRPYNLLAQTGAKMMDDILQMM